MTDSTLNATTANVALNSTPVAKPAGRGIDLDAAKKASQEFEGVFLSQMFKEMYDGVSADSEFGGGEGEEMYRSMVLDEYGKQMASKGGIGLTQNILSQLIKVQEQGS